MKVAMCTSLSDGQDSRLFFLSCTMTSEMLWHSWWKVAFKIQCLLLSVVGFAKLCSGLLITHLPMWGGNLMCSDLLQCHNNELAI
jgi:hypothetical protein